MGHKIIIATILFFLTQIFTLAEPVGYFPGLPTLIAKADAIVILRTDKSLSDYGAPSMFSTHKCYIYQTLKGDIPEDSYITLQLYEFSRHFVSPYPHGSTHLMFLAKRQTEDGLTEYKTLTFEGAQIPLSPFDNEKEPEGNTIEEKVKNLIQSAIEFNSSEFDNTQAFLTSLLDGRLLSNNFIIGPYPALCKNISPLPYRKVHEMFERFNSNDCTIELLLVYRSLLGPQTALRADAARYLGEHGDSTSIPILIDALGDLSLHNGAFYSEAGMMTTRYWANESLKKLTGQDFGFVWDDPLEKRNHAIRLWRDWYLASSDKDN